MPNHYSIPEISNDANPTISILKLCGTFAIAFFLTQFFIFSLLYIFNIDLEIISNPAYYASHKAEILIFQAVFHLGIYTLPALAYLYFVEKKKLSALNSHESLSAIPLVLSMIIPILIMPANSWVISWNQGLHLPDFLHDVEVWLRTKEEDKKELISSLTTISSFSDFILTFVVVGIIGSIGEELFFRGLIQNKLVPILRNSHLAICLTAIIFSSIHFQFFGFFPRLLLGMFLGYVYHWSKNILYPIIAHLVNNGTTVALIYLYHLDYINFNVSDSPKASLLLATISLIGTLVLFDIYRRYFNKKSLFDQQERNHSCNLR